MMGMSLLRRVDTECCGAKQVRFWVAVRRGRERGGLNSVLEVGDELAANGGEILASFDSLLVACSREVAETSVNLPEPPAVHFTFGN